MRRPRPPRQRKAAATAQADTRRDDFDFRPAGLPGKGKTRQEKAPAYGQPARCPGDRQKAKAPAFTEALPCVLLLIIPGAAYRIVQALTGRGSRRISPHVVSSLRHQRQCQ